MREWEWEWGEESSSINAHMCIRVVSCAWMEHRLDGTMLVTQKVQREFGPDLDADCDSSQK